MWIFNCKLCALFSKKKHKNLRSKIKRNPISMILVAQCGCCGNVSSEIISSKHNWIWHDCGLLWNPGCLLESK